MNAAERLVWMLKTEKLGNGKRWPRSFDALLTQRIAEEFAPRVVAESRAAALAEAATSFETGAYSVHALANGETVHMVRLDYVVETLRKLS